MGTASFPGHVATNGSDCVTCHASAASAFASWAGGKFTHAATDTNCSSCHNGTTATGLKTPPHIPVTGVQCSNCHTNTAASFATYTMGVPVTPPSAPAAATPATMARSPARERRARMGTASSPAMSRPTGSDCVTCHASAASAFASWAGGKFTHAATDTNCSSCHNGTTATGMKTPPHIPVTGVQCSNCHTNTAASFATYTMGLTGHTAVSASRCDSCHNGSFTGEGTTGALGTASYPRPRGDQRQRLRHLPRQRGLGVRQLGGRQVHPCGDRHQLLELPQRHHRDRHEDAAAYSGHRGPVQQLPHQYGGELRDLYDGLPGHTAVSASRCDSCHNGSFTGEGTKGAHGHRSFPGHVATNGRDCVTCHASAASAFASWAGGKFTHAATDTNCSSCHNGTTATGMKTPPHIPVTGVQCSNCHTNTAASFATYTMGVTGSPAVSASRCDSCHNGSFTGEGTKGAHGYRVLSRPCRDQRQDCVTCHASAASAFASWAGGKFTHAADRHQLLELPQRHHRDRHEDAAAYSGDGHPVQQLPHQYGGELRDLYDGLSYGGQRQPLRLLPQRLLHRRGHARARWARRRSRAMSRPTAATASPATPARPRPSPAGRAASSPTRRPIPIARAATTAPPRPA